MDELVSEELTAIQQELLDIKESMHAQTLGCIANHLTPEHQRLQLLSVIARLQALCTTLHISLQRAHDTAPYGSIPQRDASRNT